jgi:predicted nucleic-acid-binding protein
MIGLDTNVLARYFIAEDGADAATERQRQAARILIESGQALFLPKTVALELEWVLRGYYGFGAEQVLLVFEHLLGHPCLSAEDRPALEQAVAAHHCPLTLVAVSQRDRKGSGAASGGLRPSACVAPWKLFVQLALTWSMSEARMSLRNR